MTVFRGLDQLRAEAFENPVCTIGVFDGVHRGHHHLFDGLRAWASDIGGEAVAITFAVHPRAVLGKRPPAMLCSLDHRILLLKRAGLSKVIVLPFDESIQPLSAADFCRQVLVDRIGSRHLLMGFDSRFGRGAEGVYENLKPLEAELGLEIRQRSPLLIEGAPVSSTEVRNRILRGEIDSASRLLGRTVSIYGEVISGDGRGRTLGFPTANLNLFHSAAPPHGVYIAETLLEGRRFPSLVNIGRRPTFMREDDPQSYSRYFNEQLDKVEVYLHAPDVGDIYRRRLEVFLFDKLRDERRFESSEALIAQIERDVVALETFFEDRDERHDE